MIGARRRMKLGPKSRGRVFQDRSCGAFLLPSPDSIWRAWTKVYSWYSEARTVGVYSPAASVHDAGWRRGPLSSSSCQRSRLHSVNLLS